MFMNTWEVDEARDRYRNHPIKGPATQLLAAVRDKADSCSDGWCYWPKPSRACGALQELIRETDARLVTEARLKKAVATVKAFYTRQKFAFPVIEWPWTRKAEPAKADEHDLVPAVGHLDEIDREFYLDTIGG